MINDDVKAYLVAIKFGSSNELNNKTKNGTISKLIEVYKKEQIKNINLFLIDFFSNSSN